TATASITSPKASTIAASTAMGSVRSKMLIAKRSTGKPDEPRSVRRIGSMPYDAGLRRVRTVIQLGRPTSGKSAPDRKNIGIIRKFITTWNPCIERMYEASATPIAERPNASTNVSTTIRSEEHTSELQSRGHLVCRLLLEKKNI